MTEASPQGAPAVAVPSAHVPPAPRGARAAWLAPAVAFLLAFAVRLPFANGGLFHHDEVQLARAVEGSLERRTLLPAVKGRYGAVLLGVALYAPYHAVTGRSAERVVPFTGILTGALLVALVLLLGRELSGDGLAGNLAGAFAGTGALFLTSSSTGKENVPQVAFVVLALWLFARGAARPLLRLRAAGLAVFAFALTIHEAGVVLVPVFGFAIAALDLRHGRGWKAVALDLGVLAAALVAPVAISIWDEVLRNVLVPGYNSAVFVGPFSPILPEALRDTVAGMGAPVVALAGIGAVQAVLRRREASLLALLPWPLVILYFGNVSSYTPRYLVYALPPLAILAGAAAAGLLREWTHRRAPLAALALALVAGAPGVVRAYPLLAARRELAGPKAMSLLVKERTEPGAIVLCQDDSPFLEYYAPGRTLLKHPIDDPMAVASFVYELRERARRGERVYASKGYAFAYDRAGHLRGLLGKAFLFVPVGEVVNEWYYTPELEDVRFADELYRLQPR